MGCRYSLHNDEITKRVQSEKKVKESKESQEKQSKTSDWKIEPYTSELK